MRQAVPLVEYRLVMVTSLQLKIKGCRHNNQLGAPVDVLPYSIPECIYVVLEYDGVLNVFDLGMQMFDGFFNLF